jgi:hypothetical protein
VLPVKNYSTCSEKEPHAARDSFASQKRTIQKSSLAETGSHEKYTGRGTFLYTFGKEVLCTSERQRFCYLIVEKSTGEMLCICKIEENIIFCRFSLGSRKPRPSGTLKSSAILYIFYAFFCQHHFLYRMCINGYT